jgi:hypothetical protein
MGTMTEQQPTESERLQAELEPIDAEPWVADQQAVHLEGFSEDLKRAILRRVREAK